MDRRNLWGVILLSFSACTGNIKSASTPPTAMVSGAAMPASVSSSASKRMPGDFIVYRFTGSFLTAPLTLTERVVQRRGTNLILDLTFEQGKNKHVLRVKKSEVPGGDVVSVARMDHGAPQPVGMAVYEELMAMASLAADVNEALLKTETIKMTVAGQMMEATQKTYKVRIGDDSAKLVTVSSDKVPSGDVLGEIKTDDGRLLYHAEVVDLGHRDATQVLANSDVDEL